MIIWNMSDIIEDVIALGILLAFGLFFVGRAIYFEIKEGRKNDKNKRN